MARPPLLSIVDDDESVLRSLVNLIRSLGFRVDGFSSAEAFLDSSQRHQTACVIVDARMPGMGGLGLARALAGNPPQVPFIFISAYADQAARGEALRLGAVASLQKPCREADLLAAVNQALKMRPNGEREESMATITTTDGTQIYYKDWGTGQPIVFSHGWPLSADDWDAQMLFFLQHGYRVIAHDRRGHGRSSQTGDGHDMDHYADDLAALTAHLDLQNAVHVGHSTGGGEVVRYLARHGERRVAKAAIIAAVPPLMVKTAANPGGLPKDVFDGFQAQVARNRAQFYYDVPAGPFYGYNRPGAQLSQGVVWNWWRQGMMGSAKAHYDGIVAFSQTDFTDDLKTITVPVLVMHGDDDQIVPYADSAPLSARLLQNGTLKTYAGLPHGMPTTHADTINADLLAFIRA